MRLAVALERLEPETFLVVSVDGEAAAAGLYVQFARVGTAGLLAEAASNQILAPSLVLTPAQEEGLTAIGWTRPEGGGATGRNFSRRWTPPVPVSEVATLAVRTLRQVFSAATPAALRYRSGSFPGRTAPVLPPDLGIEPDRPEPRPGSVGQLAGPTGEPAGVAPSGDGPHADDETTRRLGAALTAFARGANLMPDEDGDIPIRVGSALMFVRAIAGRPPLVQVFSPIVRDVDRTPELIDALNDVNRQVLFGRAFWTDREIIVAMELTAIGIVPEQIAFACVQLGNLADHLDDRLRGRFGGNTVFEEHHQLLN
jgi:hypothetical protein